MFKVKAKNGSVDRLVYAVREDSTRDATYFLIFEHVWIWVNSDWYEPI